MICVILYATVAEVPKTRHRNRRRNEPTRNFIIRLILANSIKM
jgi:hypothetical protein